MRLKTYNEILQKLKQQFPLKKPLPSYTYFEYGKQAGHQEVIALIENIIEDIKNDK